MEEPGIMRTSKENQMVLKKAGINFLIGIGVIAVTIMLFSLIDLPALTGGGLTGGLGFVLLMSCLALFFISRSVFFLARHFLSPPFYKYKKMMGYAIIAIVIALVCVMVVWAIVHWPSEIDGAGG